MYTNFPSHLFVGSDFELEQLITKNLQETLCSQQSSYDDCFCTSCRKVKNRQHPYVVWIEPEKKYLLDDITVIFKTIRFSLQPGQPFFFVLKKAHALTPVCANKLLKTLEEPPPGYIFFLLTNNEQVIIPTIRSRCTIHRITSVSKSLLLPPLLTCFVDEKKLSDPFHFDQELKTNKPTEQETVDMINDLLRSIQERLVKYHETCFGQREIEQLMHNKDYTYLKRVFDFLQTQLCKPPQQGSAVLFWKKLYLEFPRRE